jgi:hypothetical protein
VSDSQVGITLRQRGIGVAAAGLLVQLLGIFAVVIADDWKLFGGSLAISACASLLSFTGRKNHTGIARIAGLATLFVAFAEAEWYGSNWFGVVVVAVGTAVLWIGNKQLAAGIAM